LDRRVLARRALAAVDAGDANRERHFDAGCIAVIVEIRLRREAADETVHRHDAAHYEAGGRIEIEALPRVLVDRRTDDPRLMSVDRFLADDARLLGKRSVEWLVRTRGGAGRRCVPACDRMNTLPSRHPSAFRAVHLRHSRTFCRGG